MQRRSFLRIFPIGLISTIKLKGISVLLQIAPMRAFRRTGLIKINLAPNRFVILVEQLFGTVKSDFSPAEKIQLIRRSKRRREKLAKIAKKAVAKVLKQPKPALNEINTESPRSPAPDQSVIANIDLTQEHPCCSHECPCSCHKSIGKVEHAFGCMPECEACVWCQKPILKYLRSEHLVKCHGIHEIPGCF